MIYINMAQQLKEAVLQENYKQILRYKASGKYVESFINQSYQLYSFAHSNRMKRFLHEVCHIIPPLKIKTELQGLKVGRCLYHSDDEDSQIYIVDPNSSGDDKFIAEMFTYQRELYTTSDPENESEMALIERDRQKKKMKNKEKDKKRIIRKRREKTLLEGLDKYIPPEEQQKFIEYGSKIFRQNV